MNIEIDISSTVLRTQRLLLRPFTMDDLEDFYEYAKVDGVGQMAGWWPHKDREESKMILTSFMEKKNVWALEKDGKVVGSLGIHRYRSDRYPEFDAQRGCEIGYVLSKEYWGQGLMPEAVKEVLRYLFEEKTLDVVFCGFFLRNPQSRRVNEKCGFHFYAYEDYETRYGTVEPSQVNILTREEWENLQLKG